MSENKCIFRTYEFHFCEEATFDNSPYPTLKKRGDFTEKFPVISGKLQSLLYKTIFKNIKEQAARKSNCLFLYVIKLILF